jgi:hypothetical protein
MDSQANLGPRLKKDAMQTPRYAKMPLQKAPYPNKQTSRRPDQSHGSVPMDIIQMLWDISKTRITQKKRRG